MSEGILAAPDVGAAIGYYDIGDAVYPSSLAAVVDAVHPDGSIDCTVTLIACGTRRELAVPAFAEPAALTRCWRPAGEGPIDLEPVG